MYCYMPVRFFGVNESDLELRYINVSQFSDIFVGNQSFKLIVGGDSVCFYAIDLFCLINLVSMQFRCELSYVC